MIKGILIIKKVICLYSNNHFFIFIFIFYFFILYYIYIYILFIFILIFIFILFYFFFKFINLDYSKYYAIKIEKRVKERLKL